MEGMALRGASSQHLQDSQVEVSLWVVERLACGLELGGLRLWAKAQLSSLVLGMDPKP